MPIPTENIIFEFLLRNKINKIFLITNNAIISPKKMIGKLSLFEKSNGILEIKKFLSEIK